MSAKMKIEGLKELREQLQQLGAVGGLKIVASAGRVAFKSVNEDAKNLAPELTGELRDTIGIAVQKPKSGNVICSIGLKMTRRKIRDEVTLTLPGGREVDFNIPRIADAGWRWHFAELGTSTAAPQPYLRPAFARNVQRIVNVFRDELRKKIEKARKRQLKDVT